MLSAAPKLLVVDATPIGSTTATGQVKQKLLAGWPPGRLLQIHAAGAVFGVRCTSGADSDTVTADDARQIARDFDPDVIYVRPLAAPAHFTAATWDILDDLSSVPVVVHIMDDWPRRLEIEDPQRFRETDKRLRDLLQRATVRMSISPEMSRAYWRRYGFVFEDYANFIDAPDVLAVRGAAPEVAKANAGHILFRYSGGLAADMSLRSLHDIADVIEEIGPEHDVRLEIGVLPPWRGEPAQTFAHYTCTTVHDAAESTAQYRRWLLGADACIVSYNFDEATSEYTRYSMANKLPDCLAVGKPILAYGPSSFATMRRCLESGGALVVGERDRMALREAIVSLALDREHRAILAEQGQQFGLRHMNSGVRRAFQQRLFDAAGWSDATTPFPPSARIGLDELAVMHTVLAVHSGADADVVVLDRDDTPLSEVIAQRPAGIFLPAASEAEVTLAAAGVLREAGYAVSLSTWHGGASRSWQALSAGDGFTTGTAAVLGFRSAPPAQRLERVVLDHLKPLHSTSAETEREQMKNSQSPSQPHAASKEPKQRSTNAKPPTRDAPSARRSVQAAPKGSVQQLLALHRGLHGVPTAAAVVLLVSALASGILGRWSWAGLLAIVGALAATASVGAIALRVQNAAMRAARAAKTNNAAAIDRRLQARNARVSARLKVLTKQQQVLAAQLGRESSRRATVHRRVRANMARLRVEMAQRQDLLEAEVERLHRRQADHIAQLESRLRAEHSEARARLEAQVDRVRAQATGAEGRANDDLRRFAELEAEIERVRAQATAAADRVDDRVGALQDVLAQVVESGPQTEQEIAKLASEVRETNARLRAETTRVAETSSEKIARLEERVAELPAAAQQVDPDRLLPPPPFGERSAAFNAGYYQPFRRYLTPGDLTDLATRWTEQLGCRISRAEIGYFAHRVGVIESVCRGRLAKTIESTVLMMMVARAGLRIAADAGRPFRVLEVGTLFGVGMAAIYDACRDRGTPIQLTAIDPLDGYYGKDVPDMITGVNVTKSVWQQNLTAVGVPADEVALHQTVSKDAYPQIQDERFDLIVIDGDHTYGGVKVDGDACTGLLASGGYLLFDDYGNRDWPDVERYVNDHLLYQSDLQKIGSGFGTIVFRRV